MLSQTKAKSTLAMCSTSFKSSNLLSLFSWVVGRQLCSVSVRSLSATELVALPCSSRPRQPYSFIQGCQDQFLPSPPPNIIDSEMYNEPRNWVNLSKSGWRGVLHTERLKEEWKEVFLKWFKSDSFLLKHSLRLCY